MAREKYPEDFGEDETQAAGVGAGVLTLGIMPEHPWHAPVVQGDLAHGEVSRDDAAETGRKLPPTVRVHDVSSAAWATGRPGCRPAKRITKPMVM